MKPTETDTPKHQTDTAENAPAGRGRKLRTAVLWLVLLGFWLWAGVQLGWLIAEIWL